MKILLITSSFPQNNRISGAFIPVLIEALIKIGCEVQVLTPNREAKTTETEELFPSCNVTYYGWSGGDTRLVHVMDRGIIGIPFAIEFFVSGIRAGLKIIKEWQPDIIHAEWLVPSGLVALTLSRLTKIPYSVRGLGSDVMIAGKKPVIKHFVRLVARGASALFADGFDLCQKTAALTKDKKCHFAPTTRKIGTQPSTFKPLDDANRFKFTAIGRLHPIKGQDILINAAGLLAKRGIKFRLYLVGDGPEQDNLAKQIYDLNLEEQVILTGALYDLSITAVLNHVNCVIIPSRSESIPLVLGEAVAASCPLVVSDVGDMRYLVETYHLGYVVSPEDASELADAIEKMSKHNDYTPFCKQQNEVLNLLSVESAAQTIQQELSKYIKNDQSK